MKIAAWAVIGLVIGTVFGLVWHLIEPSLALYFWPALGAVIFGQHAFRSNQAKKDAPNHRQHQTPSEDDVRAAQSWPNTLHNSSHDLSCVP